MGDEYNPMDVRDTRSMSEKKAQVRATVGDTSSVAREQLRAFVERIELLEEEKKERAEDIKQVYGEAKGMGFDPKILRRVIARRKLDAQQVMEDEAIFDTYLHALGMIEGPGYD